MAGNSFIIFVLVVLVGGAVAYRRGHHHFGDAEKPRFYRKDVGADADAAVIQKHVSPYFLIRITKI